MSKLFILFSVVCCFWLMAVFSPCITWACSSCGCMLSSDWAETTQSRFKLDLRYDFVDQSQLRSGVATISPIAASQQMSNGNPQEVEVYTKNYYLTASGEYTIDPSWKVDLILPYIMRSHMTLGTASDGTTAGAGGGQYDSYTSNLGDMKLLGRFQGFAPQHNWGVLFGAKLPTGSFNRTGTSTDPTVPGYVPIDRGLQPGSGTTDLILGSYYDQAFSKNWDYFTEGLFQEALTVRDDYRPGDSYNLSGGLRYFGFQAVTPQVQINSRFVEHDSGANADQFSTAGTLVYISPGLIVPVRPGLETYAFVQFPLYENLLGVQLAPTYTASLGARYMF